MDNLSLVTLLLPSLLGKTAVLACTSVAFYTVFQIAKLKEGTIHHGQELLPALCSGITLSDAQHYGSSPGLLPARHVLCLVCCLSLPLVILSPIPLDFPFHLILRYFSLTVYSPS